MSEEWSKVVNREMDPDVATAVEFFSYYTIFNRSFTELSTLTDSQVFTIAKNLSDTVLATDPYWDGFIFDANTPDKASLTELVGKTLQKYYAETVTAVEDFNAVNDKGQSNEEPPLSFNEVVTVVIGAIRNFLDSVATTEGISKDIDRTNNAELVTITDPNTKEIQKNNDLETITATESIQKEYNKGVQAESSTVTDSNAKTINKPFIDPLLDATDFVSLQVSLLKTEITDISESYSKEVDLVKSEVSIMSESKSAFHNDYVDTTYFDTIDYVGSIYTI